MFVLGVVEVEWLVVRFYMWWSGIIGVVLVLVVVLGGVEVELDLAGLGCIVLVFMK